MLLQETSAASLSCTMACTPVLCHDCSRHSGVPFLMTEEWKWEDLASMHNRFPVAPVSRPRRNPPPAFLGPSTDCAAAGLLPASSSPLVQASWTSIDTQQSFACAGSIVPPQLQPWYFILASANLMTLEKGNCYPVIHLMKFWRKVFWLLS